MNTISKLYYRAFQTVMKATSVLLPWRSPELLTGEGSVARLPSFIKEKGINSVLVVTDAQLVKLGLLDELIKGLESEGIAYTVYDKTVPNPTIENVEEGVAAYKANNSGAIIAFGGGSPMDCAKGVGARIARPNRPVEKMRGLFKVLRRLPPLFAVPTTAGTGSETTVAAIITNSATHEKYVITDLSLIPHYAVLDPLLTIKLPKHITSTTGMDALTHAVEAYIGRSNTKDTRDMALKATKLIFDNLKKAYDDGADIAARSEMQLASYYAGAAFTRAYVGYVHGIAHTLGGLYGTPHGLANAVILPNVLDAYGEAIYKQLAELADAGGIGADLESEKEKALAFIAAIRSLNEKMEIPTTIKELKKDDYDIITKRVLAESNPFYPVPVLWDSDEVVAILNKTIT